MVSLAATTTPTCSLRNAIPCPWHLIRHHPHPNHHCRRHHHYRHRHRQYRRRRRHRHHFCRSFHSAVAAVSLAASPPPTRTFSSRRVPTHRAAFGALPSWAPERARTRKLKTSAASAHRPPAKPSPLLQRKRHHRRRRCCFRHHLHRPYHHHQWFLFFFFFESSSSSSSSSASTATSSSSSSLRLLSESGVLWRQRTRVLHG
mmetsp:Transcript_50067/g.85743  ORF Transcript_50067/g.85743 Transcript_50067/m.85743 type:complete len:202 (-) Transcript_50067:305-910(-)